MDKKLFTPTDLSNVPLPKGYEEIKEEIAEEIHKRWATERIAQGWTYGECRDDSRKITNCLVPYKSLPEEEKEYDRNTAETAIKLMIKKGYTIEKHNGSSD
jgi:ryanodine receptor 2